MVARPPLRLRIEPMRLEDLAVVHAIERASFTAPWPANAYRSELETNRLAHYLVARVDDEIVGLRRHVADGRRGAHHDVRGPPGLAAAADRGAAAARVPRPGRRPARARGDARGPALEPARAPALREVRLPAGRPPAALLQRRQRGRADHDHRAARPSRRCASGSSGCAPSSTPRPPPARPTTGGARRAPSTAPDRATAAVSGPLVLAIESSCDETGIALVEDGRRIRANVVARQVALHAPTGGIVPEVAARAHLRWIVPVLDEAWADAGVDWARRRRRRRHLRAGARRLAPGRHQHREGARLGPRQAARRGQPPRGPRLRGLAARPGRGRSAPSPSSRSSRSSSRAGTRSSSRCATT